MTSLHFSRWRIRLHCLQTNPDHDSWYGAPTVSPGRPLLLRERRSHLPPVILSQAARFLSERAGIS